MVEDNRNRRADDSTQKSHPSALEESKEPTNQSQSDAQKARASDSMKTGSADNAADEDDGDESGEQSEYNYYTDEDAPSDENATEDEEYTSWERALRGIGALCVPIMVSAGLGAYLAHLQSKKPPQAWFWSKKDSDSGDSGDVELKRNELKGRCKAV